MKVYLAGRMAGRLVKDVLAERRLAKAALKEAHIGFYDPAASEGLQEKHPLSCIDKRASRKTMARYVKKDEAALDRCNAVLVLTGDAVSDGTAWEVCRAYYRNHVPIIAIAPRRKAGLLMGFSNIKLGKFLAKDINEAIRMLGKLDI